MLITLLVILGFTPSAHADPSADIVRLQADAQSLVTQLQGAQQDESLLDAAYAVFETWYPQALPYPELLPNIQQVFQGFGAAVKAAQERDQQLCRQHDLNQIARLAGLKNWVMNSSHSVLLSQPGVDLAALQEAVDGCARFQLEMDDEITITTNQGPVHMALQAEIPLQATVGPTSLQLQAAGGTLEYLSASFPGGDCTITTTPQNGALTVNVDSISIDSLPGFHDTIGTTARVELEVTALPAELLHIVCPNGSSSLAQHMWNQTWVVRRASDGEGGGTPGGSIFAGLPFHAGNPITILKSLAGSGPGPISEDGELRLRHVPQ